MIASYRMFLAAWLFAVAGLYLLLWSLGGHGAGARWCASWAPAVPGTRNWFVSPIVSAWVVLWSELWVGLAWLCCAGWPDRFSQSVVVMINLQLSRQSCREVVNVRSGAAGACPWLGCSETQLVAGIHTSLDLFTQVMDWWIVQLGLSIVCLANSQVHPIHPLSPVVTLYPPETSIITSIYSHDPNCAVVSWFVIGCETLIA